ncbi:heme ABC transporter permease [Aestuariivirga sp. YIM B02566]|uniref:Heme ABC transporter permease n=1 Tax=Taklimakanibacter albus TaxID=2800327 RepID=A0ACC5R7W2_9HYPH|nr:heme ABC transporter permease [Aestuariivirga sp. YIM B02566]MBK1868723.1 heme ABC transporter permease [Aestuariivirga sp. YIM B02566]
MQKFANPARFLKLAETLLPPIWGVTILAFAAGLYMSLVTAPPDYQQGETVRIMFVHVPAAWMALMVYTSMAAASIMAAIFRHPLADMAAKAAAPIGAMFCLLALITGSLWGKPMWGAWWVWDARLTSVFVLLLLYLGYMAVWQAIEDPHRAALIARIVAIAGFINVPIVKFSVDWWNSLHQGASVFRMGGPTIDARMLWPLLIMALAYTLLFVGLLLVAMRSEIAQRKLRQLRLAGIEGR